MTTYRASRKSTEYQSQTGIYEVLGIALDESQSGDYVDGVWCDFTFVTIPSVSSEVSSWVETNSYIGNLHVIDTSDDTIRLKLLSELNNE